MHACVRACCVWRGIILPPFYSFKPLKSESVRREKIQGVKKFVNKVTLSGGYFGGSGGLGTITKLLNFRYKNMSPSLQKELDNKLLHK